MVMSQNKLFEWLALVDRPQAGIETINLVRNSPPGRAVQGKRSNLSGLYPSKKMDWSIQYESNSGEICLVRECESSDEVLEYYDQPPAQVKISWTNKNGRNHAIWSIADYFILLRDGSAGWLEFKTEEELLDWAEKGDRFLMRDDGSWSCPSAEEFATSQGLFYRVRSDSEFSQKFERNFEALYDFMIDDKTKLDDGKKKAILVKVAAEQGITLSSLVATSEVFPLDDIMLMIARNELYVDLDEHLLVRPEQVPVFTSRTMSQACLHIPADASQPFIADSILVEEGKYIVFSGVEFQIFQTGKDFVWLQNSEGKVLKFPPQTFTNLIKDGSITSSQNNNNENEIELILKSKSPEEFDRALRRMDMLAPYLIKTGRDTPPTARRWLNKYREAEIKYQNGFIGLFDEWMNRGNRKQKIPQRVKDLISEVLENVYETSANMNLLKAYSVYETTCEIENIVAASFRTFSDANSIRNKLKQVLRRKGSRAAYQASITYWYLEHDTPRHGDRPFEVVHIDHTQLDIEIFDPKTNKSLGRPWLTLMICAYTRRVLAVYVTFEPPSYRSVMMVFRECVRRFGRIPQTVIVDNGKEFRSRFFSALCAFYYITLKYRPPHQPRVGSVIERIFGTINTQFIFTLFGNTQLMRDPRATSPSHQAANNAIWPFNPFEFRLKEFLYETYDQIDHPALFESPRSAFQREIALHGLRSTRLVAYDDTFMMNTRPSTDKGTAKVVPTKGVKINHIFYWCDDFRSMSIEGTDVAVRYEPFNLGVAYVYVKGQWQRCLSEYFAELNGLTEYEAKRISIELQAKFKLTNKKYQRNAKVYRDFLMSVQSEQMQLIKLRRDAEGRVYEYETKYSKNYLQHTTKDNQLEDVTTSVNIYNDIDIESIEILPDM